MNHRTISPEAVALNALRARVRARQLRNRFRPPLGLLNWLAGVVLGTCLGIALMSQRVQPYEPDCSPDEAYMQSVHSAYCVRIATIEDLYLKEVLLQPQIPNIAAPKTR